MKVVGLIGGIGGASSSIYYDLIRTLIHQKLKDNQTGTIILYSINQHDIYGALEKNQMKKVEKILINAGQSLERAGANFLLICSNLFNHFAEAVQKNCRVPLIHILNPICAVINKKNYKKIAVIGTRFTLAKSSYSNYLLKNSGVEQIFIPNSKQIEKINTIIFEELLFDIVNKHSKRALLLIVRQLKKKGAEALILGCTELTLILNQKDIALPILDTTQLHAEAAVKVMVEPIRIKSFSRVFGSSS